MWIITKDFLFEKKESSRNETRTASIGYKEYIASEIEMFKFRMYDDDKNLYYEGMESIKDSFAPLDEFGMPNAGCTVIKYFGVGGWYTL